MAHAIRENRPHRASGALALHVLEVMEAFATASDSPPRRRDRDAGPSAPRSSRSAL